MTLIEPATTTYSCSDRLAGRRLRPIKASHFSSSDPAPYSGIGMEVHAAPAVGKRMWSYLRAVFFTARNGLLSNKRRLLVAVHLLVRRRNYKAVARTVAALLSHHHGHGHAVHHGSNALRRRDYEFSCSNSPVDPAGAFSASSRRRLPAYFPCLGLAEAEEDRYGSFAHPDAWPAPLAARIEYYAAAAASPAPSSPGLLLRELAPGEERESHCASPALLPGADGAFSVRMSNYSSEDEVGAGCEAVDDEAEEFIRRFYEQLRRQNTIALLPYAQESAA